MEAETRTVMTEDQQQESVSKTPGDGVVNESPSQGTAASRGPGCGRKSQGCQTAPERKRSRNLSEDKRFKLFSGTANRPLTEAIGRHIGVPVGE